MRCLRVSLVLLALCASVHAETIVYDSLAGYEPDDIPGPSGRPSWLSGDLEQGIRISRTSTNRSLIRAEFFVRNDSTVAQHASTTMRFYADQAGHPGIVLATIEDVITVSAQSVEKVSVDLPSILLPNDPIWVTWYFGTPRNVNGVTIGATTSIGTDFATRAYRSRSEGSWITDRPFSQFGGGPALRLSAIPEPSGTALGLSIVALLLLCQTSTSMLR
jgi:hypothetical protein